MRIATAGVARGSDCPKTPKAFQLLDKLRKKVAGSVEAALLARRLVADYFEGAHRARDSRQFTGIYATSLGLARGRKEIEAPEFPFK